MSDLRIRRLLTREVNGRFGAIIDQIAEKREKVAKEAEMRDANPAYRRASNDRVARGEK